MKMKQLGVLVFCLLFVLMSLSINARHNHFKLYVVKSAEPFEPIVVKLKDQFGKRRLHPQQYFVLCVPTDKLEFKEGK
jgi:hypothetical protein